MRKPTTDADRDAMQAKDGVVVMYGRGDAHVRFLRDEVAPPGSVVIDLDAPHELAQVPTKAQVDAYLAEPEVKARIANAARRVEAAPIRLWEAMHWRGYDYREDVVAGEAVLVGELWSDLAANRTLMQCVQDAELAFAERASEVSGWICCGPMRMRQAGSQVEIRHRPLAAALEPAMRADKLADEITAGLHLSDGFYFRYLRRRG